MLHYIELYNNTTIKAQCLNSIELRGPQKLDLNN